MAIYHGTSGNDSLWGTSGHDTLHGYNGHDTLRAMEYVWMLPEGHGCSHLRLDRAAPHAAGWPLRAGGCFMRRGPSSTVREPHSGTSMVEQ